MNVHLGSKPGPAFKTPKKLPPLFPAQTPPRFLLIFFSVPILLIASAISGVAFSLKSPAYWISGTILWILWFLVMFLIVTPGTDTRLQSHSKWLISGVKVIVSIILIGGIVELLFMGSFSYWYVQSGVDNNFSRVIEELQESFRYNDGTALNQQAVENLLDGKNPYAYSNVVETFFEHNGSYDKLTPLRLGRFADAFPYPPDAQLQELWDTSVKDTSKSPPELESHVCYPAGSFLLPAPFIAIGIKDIRVIYFIYVIAGVIAAVWLIPKKRRIIFIGLILISLEIWNILAIGESGTIIFPFLLLAWILSGRKNWLSALFMGIAVATRQTAWFFLPFYLIMLWHNTGVKSAGKAIGIIAGVFLISNGYFIAQDPGLWLESVTSPMTTQMFPLGVGLVTLVSSGLLNITSSLPFSIMEIAVFAVAVAWYARYGKKYPEAGPVLSVLPLFFAWRSLWMYFFYISVITCAAMCMKQGEDDWVVTSN
jgi:hypothetical protein